MTLTHPKSRPDVEHDRSPVVAATVLSKRYGSVHALDEVSLDVEPHEIFGVLGPNGAGKTTLIELAVGLLKPTSGTVRVLGLDPRRDRISMARRIAVQPQHAALLPSLTVLEMLRLWASLYPDPRPVDEVLALIGLEEKAGARTAALSGGQLQRLVLGLGVVARPEVLFLDEPSAGLDPTARQRLWEIVRFQADSGAVVLSTHDMDEAATLCQRVAILDRGRVTGLGTPAELVDRHFPERWVSFVVARQPAVAELEQLPTVTVVDVKAEAERWRVRLATPDPDAVLPPLLALASVCSPREIALGSAGLKDVFVALTGASIDRRGERTTPAASDAG